MSRYVYDSSALIAIDGRRDSVPLKRHLALLAAGHHVLVPAPAAAQAVRQPSRQARLMLALRSSDIVPFAARDVSAVGRLLARSGTSDVVDAFVVVTAAEQAAAVVTSDAGDIRYLLDTLGRRLPVLAP